MRIYETLVADGMTTFGSDDVRRVLRANPRMRNAKPGSLIQQLEKESLVAKGNERGVYEIVGNAEVDDPVAAAAE